MADYVNELVKRGLISKGAAVTFADRLAAYQPPETIDDRRGETPTGYVAMQAHNDLIGAALRHFFPELKSLDLPRLEPKYHQRQAGQLRERAGYYDVNREK